jgi:hypothetical protein
VIAVYTFIAEEQADPNCVWSVVEMCRVLEVSRSGFYGWQSRPPCQRELDDRVLAREIDAIYHCSGQTYGVPRMHRWLRKQGYIVSKKRVRRLMGQLGFEGESGRTKVRTTIVDKGATAASHGSVGTSTRPPRTSSGVAISPTSTPVKAGSTWPP